MFVYSTMQVRSSGLLFNNNSTYADDDVSEICVYMKYCIRLGSTIYTYLVFVVEEN